MAVRVPERGRGVDVNEARILLGVEVESSRKELKTAYRAALKQWHPDRVGTDPEQTREAEAETRRIIDAYSLLSGKPKLKGALSAFDSGTEVPSFWRQLNPFDASHYRYSPNSLSDGIAITAVIVVGIILLIVFGM